MKKLTCWFALIMFFALTTSALAIDHTGKFAIGGYAGYSFGFGDAFKEYEYGYNVPGYGYYGWSYKNKLSFCLGANVKYGLKPNLALVGNVDYQAGDVEVEATAGGPSVGDSEGYDWTAILGNILYTFSPEKKTTPNVTGGLGLYMDGDTEIGVNLGGGVEHFFQDNLSLDAGARFHMIFTEGESTTYLQIRIGGMYYLGVK